MFKKSAILMLSALLLVGTSVSAAPELRPQRMAQGGNILEDVLGDLLGNRRSSGQNRSGSLLGDAKIESGLREALEIGTRNAVKKTGKLDGYFRNTDIRIPLPKQLRSAEKGLRLLGQGERVDDFVLSMNRAAEKAAPQAASIFLGAVREMKFSDVRRIFTGGDTAATDFLRDRTTDRLSDAFHPIVEKAMDEVGVTRQYRQLTGRLEALPLGGVRGFNLDDYVVDQSLNGLFHVLGEEEREIRRNPSARITKLLKDVFGSR